MRSSGTRAHRASRIRGRIPSPDFPAQDDGAPTGAQLVNGVPITATKYEH